MMNIEGEQ